MSAQLELLSNILKGLFWSAPFLTHLKIRDERTLNSPFLLTIEKILAVRYVTNRRENLIDLS